MLLGSDTKKKSVLVLGAGEGATAREILKYKNVSKIKLVDVDKEAVMIFKKYLPAMHKGSFDDPRVKLVVDNAGDFLKKSEDRYDVIISDMTDLDFFELGTKAVETRREFYELMYDNLKKN